MESHPTARRRTWRTARLLVASDHSEATVTERLWRALCLEHTWRVNSAGAAVMSADTDAVRVRVLPSWAYRDHQTWDDQSAEEAATCLGSRASPPRCHAVFGAQERRHRCRNCGRAVCGSCSSKRRCSYPECPDLHRICVFCSAISELGDDPGTLFDVRVEGREVTLHSVATGSCEFVVTAMQVPNDTLQLLATAVSVASDAVSGQFHLQLSGSSLGTQQLYQARRALPYSLPAPCGPDRARRPHRKRGDADVALLLAPFVVCWQQRPCARTCG